MQKTQKNTIKSLSKIADMRKCQKEGEDYLITSNALPREIFHLFWMNKLF